MIKRYTDEVGKSKLRTVHVPGIENQVERTMADAEEPGDLAKSCRRHVCGLLYICRGSRPDISFAVGCLSRRLHKWRKIDDKRLNQVMSYLATYPDLGLLYHSFRKDSG